MDINKIKPKTKNYSDKYSWQLYSFLNKLYKDKKEGKYIKNQLRIYWDSKSRWDGEFLDYLSGDPLSIRQIIVSPLGGTEVGYFMSEAMNRGKVEQYWIKPFEPSMIDITDWFWKEYEARGRCLFYGHENIWLTGDKGRYTVVNNTRRCEWCGEWQKKTIKVTKKVTRKEVWHKV